MRKPLKVGGVSERGSFGGPKSQRTKRKNKRDELHLISDANAGHIE